MKRVLLTVAAATGLTLPTLAWAQDNPSNEVGKVLDEETRVFVGPCFYPPPPKAAPPTGAERIVPSALVSGVIAALAETTLDFAVGALKAAGEEKTASAVVAFPANVWMYQLNETANLVVNPKAQCIQILSGSFWNGFRAYPSETTDQLHSVTTEKIDEATRQITSVRDPDGGSALVANWVATEDESLALKKRYRQLRTVRFFMEVRVEQMKGTQDKFFLAPNGMYFKGPMESSWYELRQRGMRNLLVTLTLTDPTDKEGNAFASVAIPFRRVEPGTKLTPLYFDGMTSRALVAPALPADERTAVERKQALYRQATEELTLIGGPKSATRMVTTNTVRNTDYRGALTAYCSAVDAYNKEALKSKKEPLMPAECPVSVADAKAKYDDAKKVFDAANAERQARANSAQWKGKTTAVTCTPINESTPDFAPGCKLVAPSDHLAIVVTATVVEIKEPSKFLAFLGSALEKSKPSITTAVQAGYQPAERPPPRTSRRPLRNLNWRSSTLRSPSRHWLRLTTRPDLKRAKSCFRRSSLRTRRHARQACRNRIRFRRRKDDEDASRVLVCSNAPAAARPHLLRSG